MATTRLRYREWLSWNGRADTMDNYDEWRSIYVAPVGGEDVGAIPELWSDTMRIVSEIAAPDFGADIREGAESLADKVAAAVKEVADTVGTAVLVAAAILVLVILAK